MISALPGATTLKPGSATFPLPGIQAGIVDDAGAPVGMPGGGYLVLERPWPSMLRGIWGDPQRYRDTYWSRFDGKYFAGDGAKRDDDGYFWLLGRVDDIMLVSGHNISTTEVESALVDHPVGRRGRGRRQGRRHDRAGDRRVRDAARRRRAARRARRASCATTSPSSSGRSRSRSRSCSPKSCRRRARARSCAGCCATSPQDQALGDTTTLADPTVVDGIKATLPRPQPPRRIEPPGASTSRNTGLGSAGRARARRGRGRRHRRRALRRLEPPALPRVAPPGLARRSSTPAARTAVIEEVHTVLDLLDPELQIVLLTARPHRVHHLTEAWLRRYEIRWDLLIMRPWGDYELARDFKELDGLGAALGRLRAPPRLRGRPPQRGDVPGRGHSLPLRALRLLRLTPTTGWGPLARDH